MWTVDAPGQTLAALVKVRANVPWSVAKQHVTTGKVFVDGTRITAIDHRLAGGEQVELRMNAQRPHDPGREGVLVYDDPHVVVIDKPAGINSVPYEEREVGTAMDLVRGAWRRQGKAATTVPLHVIHRIDRATSGLLAFAKSKRAEVGMAAQLRAHTMERTYRCVAHGLVTSRRIESVLVADRGDGLRGSTTPLDQTAPPFGGAASRGWAAAPGQGKRAITHVTADDVLRHSTLCTVRLETGRTHQIRIHLSEAGHPLVGEAVYIRDYENAGGRVLTCGRMLLHAATLGFIHPVTNQRVSLAAPLPPDFTTALERLRA